MSPCYQVQQPQALQQWRYNRFSLPYGLARPHDQRVMRLYGQEIVKVRYHPAKFCGDRHFGIRDIMVFICQVTLQDQVIKVLNDFMDGSPLRLVNILPGSVGHRHCGSGYIIVLVCHVISQDHVIKGSCDLITSSSSLQITTLSNFGAIGIAVVEI